MESLDECQERKAKRAKQLLSPSGSLAVLERSARKDKSGDDFLLCLQFITYLTASFMLLPKMSSAGKARARGHVKFVTPVLS